MFPKEQHQRTDLVRVSPLCNGDNFRLTKMSRLEGHYDGEITFVRDVLLIGGLRENSRQAKSESKEKVLYQKKMSRTLKKSP